MKISNYLLIVTMVGILVNSSLSSAAESSNHRTLNDLAEIFEAPDVKILFSSGNSKIILAADSDRGCCFWKTEKGSCTYSNEGFCRAKAQEANIKFEFYKGKSCRELQVCKK